MQCVQEGKTRDSTGNTGSTGSEHGNMHRLGKGQGTRDYYTMNNRKKGRDLATTEFGCGTRFRDSRRSCGHDDCGCHDSELAVLVSNVTWVLRDITQDHIGLVLSQNLCYPSMHEGEGIQDLCPLIHESVELHSDDDMDGLGKLFCFVPASVKTLWLSWSRTSRQVAPCWYVFQDCLHYG